MPRDLGIALALPFVLVAILASSSWLELMAFKDKQPFVLTHGTVASLDCSNHGAFRVRYAAGDATFTRGAGSLTLKLNCANLDVGQDVTVWYSARDPGFASFVEPQGVPGAIHTEIGYMFLVGFPLLACFLFFAMKARRPAWR